MIIFFKKTIKKRRKLYYKTKFHKCDWETAKEGNLWKNKPFFLRTQKQILMTLVALLVNYDVAI